MEVRCEPDTAARMLADARDRSPAEACGIVLGRRCANGWRATEYRPLPNRAPQPGDGFALEALDVLAVDAEARARGLQMLGTFHSHPSGDPRPSRTDDSATLGLGILWIAATGSGGDRLAVWVGEPGRPRSERPSAGSGEVVPHRDR